MIYLITVIHVLVCAFLIIVVLLQHGQSADIAAAFGAVVNVAPSKPAKATVARAPGFFSAIACARLNTSSVRCNEAPGGI